MQDLIQLPNFTTIISNIKNPVDFFVRNSCIAYILFVNFLNGMVLLLVSVFRMSSWSFDGKVLELPSESIDLLKIREEVYLFRGVLFSKFIVISTRRCLLHLSQNIIYIDWISQDSSLFYKIYCDW